MAQADTNYIVNQEDSTPFAATSAVSTNPNAVNIRSEKTTSNPIGGTIKVLKATLKVNNGQEIDIRGYYRDIIVEENIFSSAISGKIGMVDTEGGLEKFALHGGETLCLKFAKSGTDDILIWREDLVITKVGRSDVNSSNPLSSYDLFFSSRSHINSLKKSLFKSYKGILSESVLSIFREMSSNDIFIQNPQITLNHPFISTGVPPHKAIDYLAQRSCSKGNYYVFFERFVPITGTNNSAPYTATHSFVSIQKVIKDAESNGVQTIFYVPKLNANAETNRIRASTFNRLENFNHITGMMLGFYNTRVEKIDVLNRTYTKSKISYTNPLTEENDFYQNKFFGSTNIFSIYDDVKNEVPGRKVIFNSMNDAVPRESWMPTHVYESLSKSMFKIAVDIQGGTNNIGVGHVVNFVTPSLVGLGLNPQSNALEIDMIYSGRYLVSSVVHKITGTTYVKSVQLSRGSSLFNFDKFTAIDNSVDFLKDELRSILGNRRT